MASPELSDHATFSAPNFNVLCKPYMEDQKKTFFCVVHLDHQGKERAGLHVCFKNGNNLLDDSWF
jgi:hypothetical protein